VLKDAINLARQGRRSESDKLDRRRSDRLTIPPRSDARQLVYHRDLQALFAARFPRAGLLATFLSLVGSVRWIAPAANGQLSQQSLSLFHPRLKIFLFASPSHRG